MTYHQLQLEDRRILEKLHQQRHRYRSIAKILQVSHSTVSREIQRNSSQGYYCFKSAEHLKSRRRISANKNLAKLRPKHLRIRSRIKRKKWPLYREPIPKRPNISERPQGANGRSEYGHWELDLFKGSRRNKLAGLVLVAVSYTHLTLPTKA